MMSRNRCVAALCVSLALLLQGCDTTPEKPESPPARKHPRRLRTPAAAAGRSGPSAGADTARRTGAAGRGTATRAGTRATRGVHAAAGADTRPRAARAPQTALAVLGAIEHVRIEPPGLQLTARLDTGAAGSSLHALDVREFERDGKTWVKFQLVDARTGQNVEVSRPVVRSVGAKDASGPKRYVVSLKATIAGVAQFTEFALTDRSSYSYPVLIGRNFLRDQAVVDVGHRFTRPD